MTDMRKIMDIIDARHDPSDPEYGMMRDIDNEIWDNLQTDEQRLIKIARHMRGSKNVPTKWVRWLLAYKDGGTI